MDKEAIKNRESIYLLLDLVSSSHVLGKGKFNHSILSFLDRARFSLFDHGSLGIVFSIRTAEQSQSGSLPL